MNKKLLLALLVGGATILTGCNKKISQFDSNFFSVNPNPLEVSGEKVPGTITGKIPAKIFVKNAEVTVTPYLNVNGTEIASQAYTYQGEKVRGNSPVISYDNGGTVTIPVSYDYQPNMEDAELYLNFDVKQGNKQYVLPRVKVSQGINTTASIASVESTNPAIAPDKFQRVINEKYSADIKFLINKANIRDGELRSEAMQTFNKQLANANADSTRQIKEINISSYASPEGGYEYNRNLAEKREKNTSAYLEKHLKDQQIAEFGELTAQFTAQDWEGFQKLVAESNVQDKELILSVLSMYQDPEVREQEIRNLSSVFDQLAVEILPQLRYSRLTATVDVIGKSDEQIKEAYENDPKSLTVDELLYCATLTNDNNKKIEIYNTTAGIYGNDFRAFNNLGACQFVAKDYTSATANFKKAASINPSSEASMNLGLISMLNGEYSKANEQLGNAGGIDAVNEALGVYYLKTGNNAAAAKAFDDCKTNNAALAQILTKDYSKAKKTLASINTPDATSYYLMAVLGARTNNESMVISNLRQAAKLDSSLAAKAIKDPEFTNFNLSSLL